MLAAFSQALIRLLLLLLVDVNGFSVRVGSAEILNRLLCHTVPSWLSGNVIMLGTRSLQLFIELQPIFGWFPTSVTALNSRSAPIFMVSNLVPSTYTCVLLKKKKTCIQRIHEKGLGLFVIYREQEVYRTLHRITVNLQASSDLCRLLVIVNLLH